MRSLDPAFVPWPPTPGFGKTCRPKKMTREERVKNVYRGLIELYPRLPETLEMLVSSVPIKDLPLYTPDKNIPGFIRDLMIHRLQSHDKE